MFRLLLTGTLLLGSLPALATSPAEDAIRAVRAASNQAIAARDVEALQATWLPDLHVTASSGKVVQSGREMAASFSQAFADADFITYVREPDLVQLSVGKGYAAERGRWTGRWKEGDKEMLIRGTYLAQWHKIAAGWRIRSELFVALSCDGSRKCRDLP